MVALSDDGELLAALARQSAIADHASVLIMVGAPAGLETGFSVPVVLLPRSWPPSGIPGLLRLFAPEEEVVTLQLLPAAGLLPGAAGQVGGG